MRRGRPCAIFAASAALAAFAAFAAVLGGTIARASAAPRIVLMPVVVGAGREPPADLVAALGAGLREGGAFSVIGTAEVAQTLAVAAGLAADTRTRLAAALGEAANQLAAGKIPAAAQALDGPRTELVKALQTTALVKEDFDLVYRASALQVAVLLANGQAAEAKAAAEETRLAFPRRKAGDGDRNSPEARGLLEPAAPAAGAAVIAVTGQTILFQSQPDGCEVLVNGTSIGSAPVEIPVLARLTYQAQARCPASAGAPARASFPKRIAIADKEEKRQEVLDAAFEAALHKESGLRVRFSNPTERREREESAVRRLAERTDADIVVLVSVGDLSGTEWLGGRVYLRSGYLNRQGLVRLEAPRASALGRYLVTGREMPGVLRPEEAGQLVAASHTPPAMKPQSPWYADVVGWAFCGAGVTGIALGMLANSQGADREAEGDKIRDDSQKQDALYRDAQRLRFLGGIGTIGGGLMLATGVVLLLVPDYPSEELIALTPLPGGGAAAVWRGRF